MVISSYVSMSRNTLHSDWDVIGGKEVVITSVRFWMSLLLFVENFSSGSKVAFESEKKTTLVGW